MISTEVAHEGINSVTHINVANAKTAITRVSTTVRPTIPYESVGRFQSMKKQKHLQTKK